MNNKGKWNLETMILITVQCSDTKNESTKTNRTHSSATEVRIKIIKFSTLKIFICKLENLTRLIPKENSTLLCTTLSEYMNN